jgi:hypothetical protein
MPNVSTIQAKIVEGSVGAAQPCGKWIAIGGTDWRVIGSI